MSCIILWEFIINCIFLQLKTAIEPEIPCEPSPCGANSICRVIDNRAACSCQSGFIGSPPYCRPECTTSSECDQRTACIQQKCQNPCDLGTCGMNAECRVINHNPICTCSSGYSGDPFEQCHPHRKY